MSTFVIVHGAWGGGWEWSAVAKQLRDRDHEVFTPTLTGLGERAHLDSGVPVTLSTHVDDIVGVLEFEDLHDVLLCAASSGGMPATGACDRVHERIRLLVFIDALVARSGQCGLDLLPDWFGNEVRRGINEHGDAWRVPIPPDLATALIPDGSLPDPVRRAYLGRLRDHPAASFLEPLRLGGAGDRVPRAFLRCTAANFSDELGGDPIAQHAARAQEDDWQYRELDAPHDPQIFDPAGIVGILEELAAPLPT